MVAGGRAALSTLIDDIFDAWLETADEQAAGGNAFAYAKKEEPTSATAHAARTGDRQSWRNPTAASWLAVLCATWNPTSP